MTTISSNSKDKLILGLNPIFNMEVSHVQNSNSNIDFDVLRSLTCNLAKVKDQKKFLPESFYQHLGHIIPLHKEIIFESLRHVISLFRGHPFMDDSPLWIRLIYRKNGGLRQVSLDWLYSANNFLNRLNISPTAENIVNLNLNIDPFLAYRLGMYDLALKLALNLPNFQNKSLIHKIAIAKNSIDEQTISLIKNISTVDGENEGILASFIVQQMKLGFTIDMDIVGKLEEWSNWRLIKNRDDCNDDLIVRTCHILNSLNYIWLKQNLIDKTWKSVGNIESISSTINDTYLRSHIIGNANFHKAILAKLSGNQDQEFHFLQEAALFDHGFTDYHYRMAQILHDRGCKSAKEQYEIALRTSSFNFSIVNDYGCFLNEYGTSNELSSWEEVAKFFLNSKGI